MQHLILFYYFFGGDDLTVLCMFLEQSNFMNRKESPMLVLSRTKNESIMIGDDIEIVIVGLTDNRVRIGITAPKDVPVHRREIYDRIKANGQIRVGVDRD